MTFSASVPLSSDSPSTFPAQNQTNMSRLETIIGNDHQFNGTAASNDGYHNLINMTIQAPSGALASTGRLYAKSNVNIYPYYMDDNGVEQQLAGQNSIAASGYTTLPGGVIMQWGTKSSPGTSGSVTFGLTFPTAIFQVQLTLQHTGSGAETYTVQGSTPPSTTGFSYTTSASGATSKLFWVALGN